MKPGTLSTVRSGESAFVERINAGRGLRQRLLAMGIIPGQQVRVVFNEGSGPVIVSVRGGRVMIGRGMAGKILVNPGAAAGRGSRTANPKETDGQ